MVAIPRYRFRVGRIDGVKPDGSNWNDVIPVGHFRDKVFVTENGVTRSYWGNPYSPQSYVPEYGVTRTEQTWDETHGRPKGRNAKRDPHGRLFYDTGGPFLNVKIDTGMPNSGVFGRTTLYSTGGDHMYEGGFVLPSAVYWGGDWASSPLAYTTASNALLPDVAPYFDRAWRKAKPALEFASLYVALREAKDLNRMLSTTAKLNALQYQKTDAYKTVFDDLGRSSLVHTGARISTKKMGPPNVAEQFLNHQFGWAPFLKDLGQFYQTWVNADDHIRRITMENGQWVRKKVRVEKAKEHSVISQTQMAPSSSYALPCFPASMPGYFFTAPPYYDVVEDKTTTINAVGKFRFYRPEFDITLPDYTSAWNQVMRYVKIYGLSVNPYHVWQATPWSWLVDWVSNVGAFVERLSDIATDHVAAAYFYITAKRVIKRRMNIHLPLAQGHRILTFERTFISKQRVAADSPYGFHLTWDALSPRRLAILAALGITRRSN